MIVALSRPEIYPHHPRFVRLLQTHISYVLIAGAHVYKIKKPVRFSFLDFSTLERRRHFCHEEVRLNRRLAPDVYLGVVSICPDHTGYRFGDAGDSHAVEYAVHMRCLDDAQRLDQRLRAESVPRGLIDRIAERLVEFHAAAASSPEIAANGTAEAIWALLEDNYTSVRRFRGLAIEPDDDDTIQAFSRSFLKQNDTVLRERCASGRIRDCHGDLRADHVYATDPMVIVDCVEFSDQFRWCDVASDLAFLAMDLDFRGRSDLSARLVDRYVEASGDSGIRSLLPLYQCYRAYVRGKVDVLRSIDPEATPDDRAAATAEARAHFELSYRYTWTRSPAIVAIAGLSGSGKSALAELLARRTGFLHLNSDVIRKQLAGMNPGTRPDREQRTRLYSSEHSARTYARMRDDARDAVRAGGSVILDATFQRRADREALRAAINPVDVPLIWVECRCPAGVVRSRLAARGAANSSPSDADWRIYLQQRRSYESFGADATVMALDMTQPLAQACRILERHLRQALAPHQSQIGRGSA